MQVILSVLLYAALGSKAARPPDMMPLSLAKLFDDKMVRIGDEFCPNCMDHCVNPKAATVSMSESVLGWVASIIVVKLPS